MTAGVPDDGYCATRELVGHEGHAGGFKVERFVDKAGRQCAYYDTTLLFPSSRSNSSGTSRRASRLST